MLIQVPDKKQLLSFYFYDQPRLPTMIWTTASRIHTRNRKLPANFDFDSFLELGKEEEVQEEDLFREPSYDGLKDYIPLPVLARSRVKHLPDMEFTRISSSKAQGGTTSEY